MTLKLKALVCCLFVLYGSYAMQKPSSTRMLSTNYVTKSGEVTINKDSYGFYVNVDFENEEYEASDSEGYDPYMAYMSLGLYTSQTILAQYCNSFYTYSCASYGCTPYTTYSATPVLPDFSVTNGFYASAGVYLDYGNWELNTDAVIATSCSTYTYSGYGSGRYGILGLGVNGTTSNFIGSSSIFSIYLARDGSTGTLLFKSNTQVTSTGAYIGALSTTSDWHVTASLVKFTVSNYSVSSTINAIFDLNSDTIGIPYAMYDSIINNIAYAANMSCYTSDSTPYCSYSGEIGDLPTITLTIQNTQISLPPTLYVQDETDSDDEAAGITLGFRLLSPSYSGDNYITKNYQNYVVFGSNFMSYYYTEFSFTSGYYSISLYLPSSSSPPSPSPYSPGSGSWPFIVGGIILLIALLFLFRYLKNKRSRVTGQVGAGHYVAGGLNTSDQVPLVPDTQAHLPQDHQIYPPYNYQQGNYGYQNQANPYGFNNTQPPVYRDIYIPPAQGQYYGNGQQ